MIAARSIALAALIAALAAPAIASATTASTARTASTAPGSSAEIASAPIAAQPKNRVRAISLGSGRAAVDRAGLRGGRASGKKCGCVGARVRPTSQGKEHDELTSLTYFGFRYYDRLTLTWTQADPLYRFVPDLAWDDPRRGNLYSYTLNNPLRYFDPDGRNNWFTDAASAVGGAIGEGVNWLLDTDKELYEGATEGLVETGKRLLERASHPQQTLLDAALDVAQLSGISVPGRAHPFEREALGLATVALQASA